MLAWCDHRGHRPCRRLEALSRATGGVEDPSAPDQGSTTGTTPSEEFVGRASGEDVGYAGETGAERRAKWEAEQQQSG
jgi:hypothetical protein